MIPEVTRDQALAFRVRRQNLARRLPSEKVKKLEDVAGVCGIHAQVTSSAELQFWARLEGVTQQDVRKALWTKRSLLRIWAMRGTLHLIPARDLDVFTISLLPIDEERYRKRLGRDGMTARVIYAVTEAVGEALKDRVLTRKELAAAAGTRLKKIDPKLEQLAKPWLDSSWGSIFKPAARRGMLVSGGPDGGQATFADPDAWMKVKRKKLTREKARQELLRRYLKVYSPTNRIEFAFWAGIDNQDSKVVWAEIESEVAPVMYEGRKSFVLKSDLAEFATGDFGEEVKLLPGFDVYLQTRDRDGLMLGNASRRLVYRDQGWISAVVLIRGRVAGVWTHKKTTKRLSVEVTPFVKLTKKVTSSVKEEAESLTEFLEGGTLDLSFS